jgi:putative mRNA 3-end processing factor
MRLRLGEGLNGTSMQELRYGQAARIGEAAVRLVPAGHVLGSAQAVIEAGGLRVVVSGDYKRRRDPTCAPFEPVPCDVFVTEATFGLTVFRHPPAEGEIAKLLHSVSVFPERAHVVGVYALGKAQRVIALLREAGWDRPIVIHGALRSLCELYEAHGVALGPLVAANELAREDLAGAIVLAPPSAVAERWARRFPEPVSAFASGWMRVRARARQRAAELPLVISDHADWDELTETLTELSPGEVWVTHGREEGLARFAELNGLRAKPLHLVGYDEDSGLEED